MKINVITRCTRTSNLLKIKPTVFDTVKSEGIEIHWHIMFDTGALKDIDAEILAELDQANTTIHFIKGKKGGMMYPETTDLIRSIKTGWFYLLDDDNIMHPEFYQRVRDAAAQPSNSGKQVIMVGQSVDGKDFTGLQYREATPESTGFRKTDIAQILFSGELLETYGFTASYAADGYFIEEVYTNNPSTFVWINEVLSYYNFLEKESTPKLPRVLYIGEGRPDLKTTKVLDYEDENLEVRYLTDDSEVRRVISEFKPDTIVTRGESSNSFPNLCRLPLQFRRKWININNDEDLSRVGDIAYSVSENAMLDPTNMDDQSLISFTTPIYNTGEKLWHTYESVANQTYQNWEWILMNDSTDGGKTLKIAEQIAENDPRVTVYDFRKKSGGVIGEVKWRANVMARGYIIAELDHDDLLAVNCAQDLHNAAQKHPECGFFYGDTAEVTEDWENHTYGPGFALGYGNYREEEYQGKMLSPANQQNINPKTIRHIVGVPNHIRAWRRSTYFEIGGHNRSLTVVDDYELIVRTFLKTRMCKIPKLSYIQFLYSNQGHRNTHDLSRADIQRRTRTIAAHYNEQIKARFEELGQHDWAYEEAPHYPIHAKSRYGKEEGVVNITYNENE
tara:strand:+ start:664 stop:2517 length:1854 start_codon:yes stop_codon:yes gene_type:complete